MEILPPIHQAFSQAIDGGWMDKALKGIAPKWAEQRMNSRIRVTGLRYQAAEISRVRGGPRVLQYGVESTQYSRDRVSVMANMRDLAENFPLFAGILRKYAVYVCGTMTYRPRTGDDSLDAAITNYFVNGWMGRCDITNRHNLRTLAQLAVMGEKRDGDCGFVWVMDEASNELKLAPVESDCIGNPFQAIIEDDYVNGVVINPLNGRPIAYRIFKRSRQVNYYYDPVDYPADNFIHFFDPTRFTTYRGVSAFLSAGNTARDILETIEAMRIRLKYSAYIAALITSPSGTLNAMQLLNGGQGNQVALADGSFVREAETKAGFLYGLPLGATVEEMKTEFPAQQIQTFIESLNRDVANALNLSYDLTRGLSSLSGPGIRAVLAQDDREFAMVRQNLMDRFLNPVRNRVIFYAAAMGMIPASPFDPRLYQGKWYFPSKLTIDVGREADADVKMNAAGFVTQDDINTDAQEDWTDVTEQLGKEAAHRMEVEKKYGLEEGSLRVLPFGQQGTPPQEPTEKPKD